MATQLDSLWDAATWPQRYILSSHGVNAHLEGRASSSGNHWRPREVRAFVAWAEAAAEIAGPEGFRIYRGSDVPPGAGPSRAFTSGSRSRRIAREHAGRRGRVATLVVGAGARYVDLAGYYAPRGTPAGAGPLGGARREKEVLLLPGHVFRKRPRGEVYDVIFAGPRAAGV